MLAAPLSPRLHAVIRIALAVVGGLSLLYAFPPYGQWWIAPFSVAANVVAVRGTRWWFAFLLGLVQGLAFFIPLLKFVEVAGTDGWFILAAWCSLWIGLMSIVVMLVQRLPFWPLWIVCAWILQEMLRSRVPFGGFSWGRLAFGASDAPVTSLASLGGAPLLTFLLALMGALLVWVVMRARHQDFVRAGIGVAGAAAIVVIGIVLPLPTAAEAGSPYIAVIQGNTADIGMSAFDQARAVLDNHVKETKRLAEQVAAGEAQQPQLVLWPENASDMDPYSNPSVYSEISSAAQAIGVPIVIGAVIGYPGDPTRVANAGIVWDPVTGPGEFYIKRHPVPFGEYVPFRDILAKLISRFERVPRDFGAGTWPGVLTAGGVTIGDVICYEVAYDDIVHDAIAGGGQVLVVQTNNATYMGTHQPDQQWAITRLRAVEHGRSTLVAATTGISGWITPDGAVVQELPLMQSDNFVGAIPLRDTLTLSDRLSYWPEYLASLAAVIAAIWAVVTRRRLRRDAALDSRENPEEEPIA